MNAPWQRLGPIVLYGTLASLILGSGGVLSDPAHYNVGGGTDPTVMM